MADFEGKKEELSSKQHKAIASLISEPTITAAAEKSGIAERTIYLWLNEPAFNEAYRMARSQAVGQAIANLQRVSSDAVKVLVDLMNDKEAPAAVRKSAATSILEYAMTATQLEDHQKRIELLEKQLKGTPGL